MKVLSLATPLQPKELSLDQALGHTCSQDVLANENFPPFQASIMDGYAVVAPINPGVYTVRGRVYAGDDSPDKNLLRVGEVSYITTGSKLPPGANAVVKVGRSTHFTTFLTFYVPHFEAFQSSSKSWTILSNTYFTARWRTPGLYLVSVVEEKSSVWRF